MPDAGLFLTAAPCSPPRCRRCGATPAWPPAAWRRRSSGCGRAGGGRLAIGGATLAAEAAALGLIDEYRARVYPVLVGGGIPFFAQRERRVDLELVETRTSARESSTSAIAWRAPELAQRYRTGAAR